MSKPYLFQIDLIRIISAVAIIIIHTSTSVINLRGVVGTNQLLITEIISFFFRWGTPVFIMVSGYLLLNSSSLENPATFYRRRLSKIAIPFIFWNIFYFLLDSNQSPQNTTFGNFFSRVYHATTYYHLYFLFLICGLYVITPFLNKYIIPKINLSLWVPLLLFSSYGYVLGDTWLGWPPLNTMFTWFILYLGYYLGGYWLSQIKPIKISQLWLFALLLPLIGSFYSRSLVDQFGLGDRGTFLIHRLSPLIFIPGFTIFFFLVNISPKIWPAIKHFPLSQAANLSMGVYLIHPAILNIFLIYPPFSYLIKNNPITWLVISTILVTVLSFGVIKIIKAIPVLSRLV